MRTRIGKIHISKFAKSDAGSITATGNYTVPTAFRIKPDRGQVYSITRLIWSLSDTVNLNSGKFGNDIVLTNGIKVFIKKDEKFIDLTENPIKTNGDIATYCYDVTPLTFGSGNPYLVARWTFTKMGDPILLDGDFGDEIFVLLNDDFSGLVDQHFNFQGVLTIK